jgi:hypothetical protein
LHRNHGATGRFEFPRDRKGARSAVQLTDHHSSFREVLKSHARQYRAEADELKVRATGWGSLRRLLSRREELRELFGDLSGVVPPQLDQMVDEAAVEKKI